ncbi:hypothetical protein [Kaistella carnis]|uniref:hypothetical protein n=1 Tax=Kaistella carnis TaxID=1241979 RepID=UPI0028977953|nr:hypothetical protein [Kaistella carnis]
MKKVITRMWHGRVKKDDGLNYKKYVEETGLKNYREVKGNLSAKILLRYEDEICHILTVTEWDSYESIKKFAGEDFQKARYYPEDEKYLLDFEEFVTHYETYIEESSGIKL